MNKPNGRTVHRGYRVDVDPRKQMVCPQRVELVRRLLARGAAVGTGPGGMHALTLPGEERAEMVVSAAVLREARKPPDLLGG